MSRALAVFVLSLVFLLPVAAMARFSMEAEQRAYLIGQPVYLRIGSADAVPPPLEQGAMVLSIRAPDGSESEYRPPLRFRSGPGAASEEKDASHRARIRFARIIAADGDLVFRKPGRYLLRLLTPRTAAADSGRMVISDSLALDFSLPVRESDKRAYAILSRDPGEYGLAVYLEGGRQLKTGMAILDQIAAFPNAYQRTAAFVVSSDWSQDYLDPAGGASRPLDLKQALGFAQWDLRPGDYIPLRNAFRLRKAVEIQARRDSTAPGLGPAKDSLAAFESRLTPAQSAWLNAF